MTVHIPSNDEQQYYTFEEKRQLVLGYAASPHGTKGRFLKERNIQGGTMRRWMAMLTDGDLEQGHVPRKTGHMTERDAHIVADKDKEIEALKAELANANATIKAQSTTIVSRDLQVENLKKAVDLMGKAIASVQDGTS